MRTIAIALLVSGLAVADNLTGFYVGGFEAARIDNSKRPIYSNKINLSIDSIQNDQVKGHSVVAGNSRAFQGKIIARKGHRLQITAKEPGHDPYDGVFRFTPDSDRHTVTGRWVANDGKLAVPERKFSLERRVFRYNPSEKLVIDLGRAVYDTTSANGDRGEFITNDANKFNASKVRLRAQDVENTYKRDLEVVRNSIYARHGYSFQKYPFRSIPAGSQAVKCARQKLARWSRKPTPAHLSSGLNGYISESPDAAPIR